jgi:glycosyltransferase involved in cell wall biosynthesis
VQRLFWALKTGLGRWQADQILTVSEYSRACLAQYFHLPAERIRVVGEASDPAFRRLHDGAAAWAASARLSALNLNPHSQRLVAYVGGFGPHKNLEGLVRAFSRLAADPQFGDVRLVLVGEYRKEVFFSQSAELQAQIAGLGLDEKVLFTGFLPDEDLAVLLNCAAVLALPSWMEGFGLPAVEAAACGCPVVATTASPLPGLLGAGGLFVDPGDDKALYQSLRRVLASPELRSAMGVAGVQAAAALTWEAAAVQLRAAIQAAA